MIDLCSEVVPLIIFVGIVWLLQPKIVEKEGYISGFELVNESSFKNYEQHQDKNNT
jgi:hypothetical protein